MAHLRVLFDDHTYRLGVRYTEWVCSDGPMKDVLIKVLESRCPVRDCTGPAIPAPHNMAVEWAVATLEDLKMTIVSMVLDAPSSQERVPRIIVKN
jgi:hypothetical protein